MKKKRWLAATGAVVGLLAVLAAQRAFFSGVSNSRLESPTVIVEKREFQQRISAEGVIKALRSTPLAAPDRTHGPAKIAWLAEDGIFVKQGDLVVRFDPTDHERRLIAGEVALSTAENKMEQTEVKRDTTLQGVDRDRELAEYELEMARAFSVKDPMIFSRVEIIEAEIDEQIADLRLQTATGRGEIQKLISASEMEIHSIERSQAEFQIQRANESLNALEIRAPHDGIVVFNRDRRGNVRQVGDIVYGRQAIAELPSLETMRAEIHVLEADAGDLKEGIRAEVIVEAAPEKAFQATVARVDRMPKPRIRGVPVQYFSVMLDFEATDPEVMKPGQRVRARLFLSEPMQALIIPRHAVFRVEGESVVYAERNGAFVAVPVKLGATSVGSIVVEEGLEPGERIALTAPGDIDEDLDNTSGSSDAPLPSS